MNPYRVGPGGNSGGSRGDNGGGARDGSNAAFVSSNASGAANGSAVQNCVEQKLYYRKVGVAPKSVIGSYRKIASHDEIRHDQQQQVYTMTKNQARRSARKNKPRSRKPRNSGSTTVIADAPKNAHLAKQGAEGKKSVKSVQTHKQTPPNRKQIVRKILRSSVL